MRIRHVGSGRTIAENAVVARNYWQRFRGLMLRRRLVEGSGLVIEPCSSIHMMFMWFSIDAVFFDRAGKVTKVARNVRPWIGFAGSLRGARGVIELPVGAADGILIGNCSTSNPRDPEKRIHHSGSAQAPMNLFRRREKRGVK